MTCIRLVPALLGIGSLSLSACDLPLISELTGRHTAAPSKPSRASARPASRTVAPGTAQPGTPADPAPRAEANGGAPVNLVGLDEQEVRALLGPPAAEENRPPAKIWRYRKGGCSLDVSLYPDVQTRKFGTLTYEVKSDDNTDEGKRACLADIRSRQQAR